MTTKTPFNPTGADVDQLLAQELNNLSFQDRAKIHEEIHGVNSLALKETSTQIKVALRSMQEEMEKTDPSQKVSYYKAMETETSFIHDDAFRLKLLRTAFFDTKKACQRMMTHLRFLEKYFGPEALKRPPRLSDFPTKEQTLLRKGHIQLLPSRDRAGRLVAFDYDSVYASSDTADMIPRMVRHDIEFTVFPILPGLFFLLCRSWRLTSS
jgi:hypothetical protein